MSKILCGTDWLLPDEPCFCLKEVEQRSADSRSYRRVQCIQVVRNDQVTEFQRDLGPAADFRRSPVWFITGARDPRSGRIICEYTVAEAMEMADRRRAGLGDGTDIPEPSDLIGGYYDQQDKKRHHRKGQSTFGYGGQTQRS